MLEADIAENRGVRSYHSHSEDASVDVLPPFYYSNNEIRLHKGQYLALGQRLGNTASKFNSLIQ
jgi:hypothetical protein